MSNETKSEFWRRHFARVENPVIHFVPSGGLDVGALERACSELGFVFFRIDALHVQSVPDLMDAFAEAMNFPSYFGHNWDALLDLTRDLSWQKAKGYVLVLSSADSLSSLTNNGFSVLLAVLEATVREWRDERGEYGERAASIPFHIVFSGSDALRETLLSELKEPLCEHKSELSVRVIRTPGGVAKTEGFRDAQKLVQLGADLELVLSFLRERGVGVNDSIYAVASLLGKSISEAKGLVDKSQTWSDRYETDRTLRNAARKLLHDLGYL